MLKTNYAELADIVNDLAPGLLDRSGVGPFSAAQVIGVVLPHRPLPR